MVKDILFDGEKLNDYTRGRISGMVHALTGFPEKTYGWGKQVDHNRWILLFMCPDGMYDYVVDTIKRIYPDVIIQKEK